MTLMIPASLLPPIHLDVIFPSTPPAAPINLLLIRQHGEEMGKLITSDPFSTAARNAANRYLFEIFQIHPTQKEIQDKIFSVPTQYLLLIYPHINSLLVEKTQINLERILNEISKLYDQLQACADSISAMKNSFGTGNFFEDVDTFLINASFIFDNINNRVEAKDCSVNPKEKLRFCTRLNDLIQRGTNDTEVENLILELIEYKKHFVNCVNLSRMLLSCIDIELKRIYVIQFLECFKFFHPGYSYLNSLHMYSMKEQEALVTELTNVMKKFDAAELKKYVRLSLEQQDQDSADEQAGSVRIVSIHPHPMNPSVKPSPDDIAFQKDPSSNPKTILNFLKCLNPKIDMPKNLQENYFR